VFGDDKGEKPPTQHLTSTPTASTYHHAASSTSSIASRHDVEDMDEETHLQETLIQD
jgi:hypothetical protein